MLPSCLPEGGSDLQDCQKGQTPSVPPRPGQHITLDLLPGHYQLLFLLSILVVIFSIFNRNVCHISGNLGRQKAICCSFSSFQRTTTSLFFSHDMSHRRNLPMSGLQINNKSGMVISQGQFTTFSPQLMLK